MSERMRGATVRHENSERGPSLEDLRRQLEGRLEVLEAARERYVRLRRALLRWRWELRLRRKPELVRAVLQDEPAFAEALERVLRRAQSERWPEKGPALAFVRDVRESRARLEALVHQRLKTRVRTRGPPSLVEELERLELIILGVFPLKRTSSGAFSTPGEGLRENFGDFFELAVESTGPVSFFLALLAGLPLEKAEARWANEGQPDHLTAVLEIRRRLPDLFARSGEEGPFQVVCFPATLREGKGAEVRGHAVLRPDSLSFLPEGTAPEMLRALAGPESPPVAVRVEVPWLVGQLRHLSGADFDLSIARATKAVGGRRWALGPGSRLGLNGVQIHFAQDGCELRATVTGPALRAAGRLIFTRRG